MTTATAPARPVASTGPGATVTTSSSKPVTAGCGCQGRADLIARGLRGLAVSFEQRKGPTLAAVLTVAAIAAAITGGAGYLLGQLITSRKDNGHEHG
jgi:hypothetical protein